MGASSEEIARHMRQLFDAGSAAGLTDGELLARFACRRAESESNPESASAEAAFEALLARIDGSLGLPPNIGGPARGRRRFPSHFPRVDSPVRFIQGARV
jgi:hypothetical protein